MHAIWLIILLSMWKLVLSWLAVIMFFYLLKLYIFCLATDCRFVIWHYFRLRMIWLELHAKFLISSYLLLMLSIWLVILLSMWKLVLSWLAVIMFFYLLKLYIFCLATDCRFVIWHYFRLRMIWLELNAKFLISSNLLLMHAIWLIILLSMWKLVLSWLAVIMFFYSLKLYIFCLATDCRFVIWHYFRLRMIWLELNAKFLISSNLLLMHAIWLIILLSMWKLVLSWLAVIMFFYSLKLYIFCLATDCRFVIWHYFRLRMIWLELNAKFLISSNLLLMHAIWLIILLSMWKLVLSWLAVIMFIYSLKLYIFCLATDCRFVIWHYFRLRMIWLELHAKFLISSNLLLMHAIWLIILLSMWKLVLSWLAVIMFIYSLKLYIFCLATDCRFVIWHYFRLRMIWLELNAKFLISRFG